MTNAATARVAKPPAQSMRMMVKGWLLWSEVAGAGVERVGMGRLPMRVGGMVPTGTDCVIVSTSVIVSPELITMDVDKGLESTGDD